MKFSDNFRKWIQMCRLKMLVILVPLAVFASCNRSRPYDECLCHPSDLSLIGIFVADRYYDPTGLYSILIPGLYRSHIEEKPNHDKLTSDCIFCSKDGTAISICAINNAPLSQIPQDEKAEFLKLLFHENGWPHLLKDICAEAENVHEEVLEIDGNPSLFIVAKYPKGSFRIGTSHQRPVDNYLGQLLFIDHDQFVLLAWDSPEPMSIAEKIERIRDVLLELQSGYHNEIGGMDFAQDDEVIFMDSKCSRLTGGMD